MGIEKLVDLLVQFIGLFQCWEVVNEFQEAVILRLGKFHKVVGAGFHWRLPVYIDEYMIEDTSWRTNAVAAITATNIEGHSIHVDAVLKWRVKDIKKFLLEIDDSDAAIRDIMYGGLSKLVRRAKWDNLIAEGIDETLTKEIRRRGWRYGIEVESVELGDLVKTMPVSVLE